MSPFSECTIIPNSLFLAESRTAVALAHFHQRVPCRLPTEYVIPPTLFSMTTKLLCPRTCTDPSSPRLARRSHAHPRARRAGRIGLHPRLHLDQRGHRPRDLMERGRGAGTEPQGDVQVRIFGRIIGVDYQVLRVLKVRSRRYTRREGGPPKVNRSAPQLHSDLGQDRQRAYGDG